MLKTNFSEFQKKIEQDRLAGHVATVHCMTGTSGFTFVMRSRENIKYYTVMTYEEITVYAREQDIDAMDAIDMFATNYCTNTLPITVVEYHEMIEVPELAVESEPTEITTKTIEIDAGDDIIDEAEDYSDFLRLFFDKFEKKVLSSVDKINLEKSQTKKNFGEFLTNLFNTVNSIAFAKNIKRFIKADLIAGLTSAEAELNTDIGFTDAYESKLNVLASQQIDGYMINGKKWPGIKGVTKEIQAKVIETVQSGINENQTTKEIKEAISEDFDNFTDWRSDMIARTETNRIVNEGKIVGYKESGIEGGKIVMVVLDNRTSPICQRMFKMYGNNPIDLDDDFIDPETNKAYRSPPFHPNCRTVLAFRSS